ncbi:MAG: membrane dipeptidase [Sphingobium sp.]
MNFAPKSLIGACLVWDNHACMPLRPHDESFLPRLQMYRDAGVNVVSLNVGFGEQGIEEHVRMLAQFRRWLSMHGNDYILVRAVADIDRAHAEGKLAIVFDIEGANAIADQISMIQLYYELGVRWMSMAYNLHNRVGGGCQQEGDPGLTEFGRLVLDEMGRVGMVACCSHTGYRTAMDVLEYSDRPVIFSHSNAFAVHPHPRNIGDDLIRACARNGGLIGVNGIGIFVSSQGDAAEGLARHIDHIVSLAGIEHVALGLDYVVDHSELDELTSANPAIFPPELGYGKDMQMIEPGSLVRIIEALCRMGYADADLCAVLGGNLMRIARTVWK